MYSKNINYMCTHIHVEASSDLLTKAIYVSDIFLQFITRMFHFILVVLYTLREPRVIEPIAYFPLESMKECVII